MSRYFVAVEISRSRLLSRGEGQEGGGGGGDLRLSFDRCSVKSCHANGVRASKRTLNFFLSLSAAHAPLGLPIRNARISDNRMCVISSLIFTGCCQWMGGQWFELDAGEGGYISIASARLYLPSRYRRCLSRKTCTKNRACNPIIDHFRYTDPFPELSRAVLRRDREDNNG